MITVEATLRYRSRGLYFTTLSDGNVLQCPFAFPAEGFGSSPLAPLAA